MLQTLSPRAIPSAAFHSRDGCTDQVWACKKVVPRILWGLHGQQKAKCFYFPTYGKLHLIPHVGSRGTKIMENEKGAQISLDFLYGRGEERLVQDRYLASPTAPSLQPSAPQLGECLLKKLS